MGKLQINLLNTSFTIQANEDEAHLQKLLGYYSKIVEDVSQIESVKNPLQTSILAGIMLCDELYKEKSNVIALKKGLPLPPQDTEETLEVERHTLAMINKINKVL